MFKHETRYSRFHLLLLAVTAACVLSSAVPALAASTSVVTDDVPGKADVVKAAPYSHWLALWSEQSNGKYTLWVVDANNGRLSEVTGSSNPGGFCWIPREEKLFYTKATFNSELDNYHVFYYEYDPNTKESRKIRDVRDVMETFRLDPIAAEDGSLVFHLTYDNIESSFGAGLTPTFHYYYPQQQTMDSKLAAANIGSDFDLSSDGMMLYWPLFDENTSDLYFVGWSTTKHDETWNAQYYEYKNPADGGGMIRIDGPNQTIALLAQSNVQPRMQMCLYGWQGKTLSPPIPVFLEDGEEILHYDWLGITGKVYAVIARSPGGPGTMPDRFSLEVLDPLTGLREVLVSGSDKFGYADYAPGTSTYYYPVINTQGREPRTLIIRAVP